MAEYLIQDSTLDAIADAINAKTGGSSAMTPVEMVTEIEGIETGGIPLDGVFMASGSFVVASATGGTISINHGLGKTPFMVIVMPTENALIRASRNLGGVGIACKLATNGNYYAGARFYSHNNYPAYTHNPNSEPNSAPDTTYICGFNSTKFDFTASTNFPPIIGEYQWVALAFKETR